MKNVLSSLLVLGGIIMILQGGVAAEAATAAEATSSAQQSVTSGSFQLTAVHSATDANTGTSLLLAPQGGKAFFYLKNFGTTALKSFAVEQTRAAATVRYCVGQEFKPGDVATCHDNTAALLVVSGRTLAGVTFAVPLAPGAAYAFSAEAPGNAGNVVSVSVSAADITPLATLS